MHGRLQSSDILKSYLWDGSSKELHALLPLKIKLGAKAGSAGAAGWKETWDLENSQHALKTQHLYEAGGSLFWTELQASRLVPTSEPSMAQVAGLADCFFGSKGGDKGADAQPQAPLYIPVALDVTVTTVSTSLPRNLTVIGGGEVIVFSWYLAAYGALKSGDMDRLRRLIDAALSVTLRCHLMADVDQQAAVLLSLAVSENLRSASGAVSDSYLLFVEKLVLLMGCVPGNRDSQLRALQDKGVKFQGAILSRQMLTGAISVSTCFDEAGKAAMLYIDREFSSALSGTYSKVVRMAQLTQSWVKGGSWPASPMESMTFVLQSLLLALRRDKLQAQDITVTSLDNRGASAGWTSMTLAKLLLLHKLLIAAKATDDAALHLAVSKVIAPEKYHSLFPVRDDEEADSSGPMREFCKGLSAGGQNLIELITDIQDCLYDAEFKTLAGSKVPSAAIDNMIGERSVGLVRRARGGHIFKRPRCLLAGIGSHVV